MSYRNLISCHVSDALRADFYALAKTREVSVARLLRELIAREVEDTRDQAAELREQVLFLAIAMDGLLAAHSDPELRPKLIRIWQDRLAREGRDHAA